MFGHPICLDAPLCLEDVWMPAVHIQHKESMLCHTKGCPYAPYIWMPHMFGSPHMFGWPPVCLNAPICVETPCIFGCLLCLDATYMFGHHPVCLNAPYVWMLPICLDTTLYVWIMFGCPHTYTTQSKAGFATLRECPYAPYIWMPPCLDTPICLDAPICLNTLLYVWPMFGCPLYIDNT